MTKENKVVSMLRCPICVADQPHTSEPDKPLPEYNFNDLTKHWDDVHMERVIRRYYARMLFAEQKAIPIEKIDSKIKEFRESSKNDDWWNMESYNDEEIIEILEGLKK